MDKVWIQMKTYEILKEGDICKILEENRIKQFSNAFEITFKNVKRCVKRERHKIDLDSVWFDAHSVIKLTIHQINNSVYLRRDNGGKYNIIFKNIQDENGECFSSFVDNLCENDKILIIDGILFRNSITFNHTNRITIAVLPKNNAKVLLFKQTTYLSKPSIMESNLSKLTGSGFYSLLGKVTNITKYTDEGLMVIRIQCSDKSCIKIHKYPCYINKFANISKEERKSGIKYDFSSNKVDILVNNPCLDFISLLLNQQIIVSNIKVVHSIDSDIYSLHVKGKTENLKTFPIEIGIKSIRPPEKKFTIPNDLMPIKTKKISNEDQLNRPQSVIKSINYSPKKPLKLSCQQKNKLPILDTIDDKINRFQGVIKSTKISHKEHLPLRSNQQNEECVLDLEEQSTDIVNYLSPRHEIFTSKNNCYEDMCSFYENNDQNSNNQNNDHCLLNKKTNANSQTHNQIQKCCNSTSNLPKENNCLMKVETSSEKESSPDLLMDDSCSPPFLITCKESTPSREIQPKSKFTRITRCIGPCRLIYIEPYVLFNDDTSQNQDFVSGYCKKCFSFFPKTSLTQSHNAYKCPRCFVIVQLTFFFKMNFLYGIDYKQALEVCCYNENAEHVIKKLSKKHIKLKNYMSNQGNRKLITETMKSLICNKTKMNIIVCDSPNDKMYVLLSVDTKYVVTSPIE